MRLTNFLSSGHDNGHARFGNLAKVHGIVVWKLSPFEQRAFAGAIRRGLPNLVRRFLSNVIPVGIPFLLGTLLYVGVEHRHRQLLRKNPADYENEYDVDEEIEVLEGEDKVNGENKDKIDKDESVNEEKDKDDRKC